ncbi:MAG: hypothetical protein II399_02550 [Lachnospiraceae bacterium]|nr:hypothetical protein [Lachnospiraceae bacterium]
MEFTSNYACFDFTLKFNTDKIATILYPAFDALCVQWKANYGEQFEKVSPSEFKFKGVPSPWDAADAARRIIKIIDQTIEADSTGSNALRISNISFLISGIFSESNSWEEYKFKIEFKDGALSVKRSDWFLRLSHVESFESLKEDVKFYFSFAGLSPDKLKMYEDFVPDKEYFVTTSGKVFTSENLDYDTLELDDLAFSNF